jgi:Holliday junction resolvase
MIAAALRDAKNDEKELERELVAAFDRLGFDAIPVGGKDAPDGLAYAPLAGGADGAKGYVVTLEAKSKRKAGAKVSAATVNPGRLARHRKEHDAQHAFVIGPSFPTTRGPKSAVAREMAEDRKATGHTITLATVDDFADLVAIAPKKRVDLKVMKAFFERCSLPEDVAAFVRELNLKQIEAPPYAEILDTIWTIQRDEPNEPVAYQAVSTLLRTGDHAVRLTSGEVHQHCVALMQMAPQYVIAQEGAVELNIKPERVMQFVDVYPSVPEPKDDDQDVKGSARHVKRSGTSKKRHPVYKKIRNLPRKKRGS